MNASEDEATNNTPSYEENFCSPPVLRSQVVHNVVGDKWILPSCHPESCWSHHRDCFKLVDSWEMSRRPLMSPQRSSVMIIRSHGSRPVAPVPPIASRSPSDVPPISSLLFPNSGLLKTINGQSSGSDPAPPLPDPWGCSQHALAYIYEN
jgi:hypothetical protein